MVVSHVTEAEGTRDVGNQEDKDEKATFVLEAIVQKDTDEDAERDEDAIRYLHQRRAKRRETEALDDDCQNTLLRI